MVRLLFLYYSTWLNPEARKMKRFLCSDWLPGRARWARFSPAFFPSFSLSLFLAKFSILIAEYWPLSFFLFCVFIDVLSSSRSIKTCKITWPISSHLDLKFRIDVPLSKVPFRFCERQMRGVGKDAFFVPMHLVLRVLYVGKHIWTCPVQTRMPRQEAILERRIEGGQL